MCRQLIIHVCPADEAAPLRYVGIAVTLWTCILEVLGLKVGPDTGYPDLQSQMGFAGYVSVCMQLITKSKLYIDRRSVGQSVLVSGTHLRPATKFSSSFFNYL
jgi:hypothetical protein